MDNKTIGLITYQAFIDVLHNEMFTAPRVKDNFDWENTMVTKIRNWIKSKNLTIEEAFKCFDMNFAGFVTKDDLNKSL